MTDKNLSSHSDSSSFWLRTLPPVIVIVIHVLDILGIRGSGQSLAGLFILVAYVFAGLFTFIAFFLEAKQMVAAPRSESGIEPLLVVQLLVSVSAILFICLHSMMGKAT
jgi:hypothetical protein